MSAAIEGYGIRLRAMMPRDVPAISRVERAAYDYPWSPGIFRDCMLAGYTCLVVEGDDGLVGYAIMSIAAAEAHVLNVCIHPDFQRQGLGRQVMGELLDRARVAGAGRVFLEVRPSNRVARCLYASLGFREIGVRPRYYQSTGGREDAVVLATRLDRG